jgi:hypothetical protein
VYEFQKTVRRHKFGFAAATALILVLTAGVLTSTWQAVEATRPGRRKSANGLPLKTPKLRRRRNRRRPRRRGSERKIS